MSQQLYLSVIIPIYNEEKILVEAVNNLVCKLKELGGSFEILLTENGSKDNTRVLAKKLEENNPDIIKFLSINEPNYGKALREGILKAKGEIIINDEIDIGDFDFYKNALNILKQNDIQMVIGSKQLSGSGDLRPWNRKIASLIINLLFKIVFGFKGTETHGLKAWKSEDLKAIIEKCVTEKDIFVSEVTIRAEQEGIKIKEIPIKIEEKRDARIKLFKRVPSVLKNIYKLSKALKQ